MKLVTVLFGLAILLSGCSSSYLVSSTGKPNAEYSYQEMNEKLIGWDVEIELKDGSDISAKDVKISDDSVSWVDKETNAESKASTLEINKIVIESSPIGALEGAGFGLVGGGGLGALVGQIIVGNDSEWGTGAGAAVGLILGGGTGLIVGSITGAIIGHSYNYEFPTSEQSDSLQIEK
jgi:uncharacterized protein YceK